MSSFKKTKSKTVVKHLHAFADWLEDQDKDDREEAADLLNAYLDTLLALDAFGTEGQNDPRGDHRE